MAELMLRCQFGERRDKAGRVTKPASCTNRASGIWRVTLRQGRGTVKKIYFLCAGCAFHRLPARVRMIAPRDDDPYDKPKFFKDVVGVELLTTLGSQFNVGDFIPLPHSKGWVEGKAKPSMKGKHIIKVRRIKDTEPKMDMSKYLESLRRHDDGK